MRRSSQSRTSPHLGEPHLGRPLLAKPLLATAGLVAASAVFAFVGSADAQEAPPEPETELAELDRLTNEQCLACHDRRRLEVVLPSGETLDAAVSGAVFEQSVHGQGGVECDSCHRGIDAYPHPDPEAETARELTEHLNATCGSCHGDEMAATGEGAHAVLPDVTDAPVCSDCHGAHDVAPPQDPVTQVRMCQNCHDNPDFRFSAHGEALIAGRPGAPGCATCHGSHTIADDAATAPDGCRQCHSAVTDIYDVSAHGSARAAGETEAAACSDCHGAIHEVRHKDDPDSPVYPLRLPETCGTCHGDPELAARHDLPDVYSLYIDSIHGTAISDSGLLVSATCSECHGSHDIQHHDEVDAGVFPSNVMQTCGKCHEGIVDDYYGSVHGEAVASGDLRAAVCTDCHTSHQISRSDQVEWQLDVVEECGTCHEESLTTYRDTFHGQVTALGYTRVARCSDCHGYHTVQAVHDPDSSVSGTNEVATCQKCHEDANENFAAFSPHADSHDREKDPTLFFTRMFMETLIIGVFAFFGLHTVMWGIRSGIIRSRQKRGAGAGEEPSPRQTLFGDDSTESEEGADGD